MFTMFGTKVASEIMWVKQCHKPPMTGNGKFIPPINLWWWLGDGGFMALFHPHWNIVVQHNTQRSSAVIVNEATRLSHLLAKFRDQQCGHLNECGYWCPKSKIQPWSVNQSLAGWWLSPTPLKNDGVKVSWDDDIPNWMEEIKMFQTTNQIGYWFMVPSSWFMGNVTNKSWVANLWMRPWKNGWPWRVNWFAGQNG